MKTGEKIAVKTGGGKPLRKALSQEKDKYIRCAETTQERAKCHEC
jgi:hypothetical protein